MQDVIGFRRGRSAAIAIVAIAVLVTACSGGVRPTLTGDQLEDAAASVPLGPTAIDLDDASSPAAGSDDPTAQATDAGSAESDSGVAEAGVERLFVEVIETFPHDETAWTQGLELHDGAFIESTGLTRADDRPGESSLRRVVPSTGEVTQIILTPNGFFAEGVTKVGDQLIQLTWQNNTAFYWDAESFELNKEVTYQGEGWGICYDGARLIMTDGSQELTFRDPATFDETGRVSVTLNGQPVGSLNEVECVNGVVWANVWLTDFIVRIYPATGEITGLVYASSLEQTIEEANVLNGIAWDESTQSFYVTGKFWPTMYRVNFVPAPTS